MKEIHVKSQEELNAIADDYDGRIYIEFGTPDNPAMLNRNFVYSVVAYDNSSVTAYDNSSIVACDNSSVTAYDNSSVTAYDNSSVTAYDNSSVTAYDNSSVGAYNNSSVVACGNSSIVACDNSSVGAYDNSSVTAYDNSSVVARGNSSIVACDNSSVVACGNSSIVAYDNSSVKACDNSSVVAYGNTQVVQCSDYIRIGVSGNARIVHNPTNISEYLNFYGIDETNGNIKLYKAVHKCKNRYFSDRDSGFEYVLGEIATADSLTENTRESCGHGIHIASINWCLNYGKGWNDLAILEVEAETDKIVVPHYTDGKVRTLSVKVLREVPLEECGLFGKMLTKRRAQREAVKVPEQESEV